jgi:ribonuclease HI
LLKGERKFKFGEEEKMSFEMLKQKLCEEPVLKIFDFEKETELHTDASRDGYGTMLVQRDDVDGKFHPVYYMSRKTTDAEKKYSSYELEVLAIIEALKKFRTYLLGIKFKIKTDCSAFTMTMKKKDLVTRVARWALLLEEFDYVLEHRPGNSMKHCDALSRNPIVMSIKNAFLEKLSLAQQNDAHLKVITEVLKMKPYKNFVFEKNLLYKDEDGTKLLVIPEKMEEEIIINYIRRENQENSIQLCALYFG